MPRYHILVSSHEVEIVGGVGHDFGAPATAFMNISCAGYAMRQIISFCQSREGAQIKVSDNQAEIKSR